MTITADVQTLAPGALIELFVLDTTPIGGTTVLHFHSGVTYSASSTWNDVVWQGQTYTRWPAQAQGFEWTGKGQLPRPKITVANILGTISAVNHLNNDLVGAKVTRKRTLLKYLDAINFPGGTNATADPTAAFNDEIYYVDRKSNENPVFVEYELSSSFDCMGKLLPGRPMVNNSCPWAYKGPYCGYAGVPVADINDVPVGGTGYLGTDVCGKRLASCLLRFPTPTPLPFGGFPSAGLT